MVVGDIRLIFSLLAVLLTTSVNAAARPMGQRPSEQLLPTWWRANRIPAAHPSRDYVV
jgi:hypothetical protein